MHGTIKRTQVPIIKKRLLADINSVMAATEFEAKPSILCDWCGYNPICKEARGASRYSYKDTEDYSVIRINVLGVEAILRKGMVAMAPS